MLNQTNLIIGGIVVVILLGIGTFLGWNLRKSMHPDLVITHDTTYVVDKHWHHIADSLAGLPPKEVWKWHPRDTVRIPGQIITLPADSTSIRIALEDYVATYDFGHEFITDSLEANVGVRVNRNRPIAYTLDYKFKIPYSTTINQPQAVTNYSSYIQGGIEMPLQKDIFNTFKVEATAIFPKWYGGVEYQPLTNVTLGTNTRWSIRGGITIFKIKTRK